MPSWTTRKKSTHLALIPIIVYCFDKNGTHPTDAEIRKIVKWFFYSQVRTRYTSQLPRSSTVTCAP